MNKIVTLNEIGLEMEKWVKLDFLLRVLKSAEPYIVEALAMHDEAYDRHPSCESERKIIVEDLNLIRAAIDELKEKL